MIKGGDQARKAKRAARGGHLPAQRNAGGETERSGRGGLGIAAALTGAAAVALGLYFSKHWQSTLPVLAFTGWQLLLGGAMLLPVALLTEPLPQQLTWQNIGGYLYLCLFGSVLAYLLFFRGLRRLPAAVVASLGLLSPVCAFVLGWLLLGQTLDGKGILGFVLILAAIIGVQRATRSSG